MAGKACPLVGGQDGVVETLFIKTTKETEIDRLVYWLYDLTADEIKLIETA